MKSLECYVDRRITRSTGCAFESSFATPSSSRNWLRISRAAESAACPRFSTWFHCRSWRAVRLDVSTKSTRFVAALLPTYTQRAVHTQTRNRFVALFPGLPGWAGARRNLYGAREDNRGRHTNHPAGRHSVRTNQRPTSHHPPLLCQMPFLPQPCHFILAWHRHQIWRLAYPVACFTECSPLNWKT